MRLLQRYLSRSSRFARFRSAAVPAAAPSFANGCWTTTRCILLYFRPLRLGQPRSGLVAAQPPCAVCGKQNPRHPGHPQFQSSRSLVCAGGDTLRPCRIVRKDPKSPKPDRVGRVLIRSMPINSRTGAAGTWPRVQPCPGCATGNRI